MLTRAGLRKTIEDEELRLSLDHLRETIMLDNEDLQIILNEVNEIL